MTLVGREKERKKVKRSLQDSLILKAKVSFNQCQPVKENKKAILSLCCPLLNGIMTDKKYQTNVITAQVWLFLALWLKLVTSLDDSI